MSKNQNGLKRVLWLAAQILLLAGTTAAQNSPKSEKRTGSNEDITRGLLQGKASTTFLSLVNPGAQGLHPVVFYGNDDRFFVGLIYNSLNKERHTDSTGYNQSVWLHYSISQKAFSVGYQGIVNRIFGRWNLIADASYDWVRWTNFYGIGNQTVQLTSDANFYRVRSRDAFIGLGFQHKLGQQSSFSATPFYHRVELRRDESRFFTEYAHKDGRDYDAKNFAGIRTALSLQRLNDLLVPTKGLAFEAGVDYGKNLQQTRSFAAYNGGFKFYLPLSTHFFVAIENAATTVTGQPEFYQLASLGSNTLRGFRRDRFRGQTAFHNNNEVHYIFDAPWKIVGGKMGFLAFADQGRVWNSGEKSDVWHRGYGGGIFVAPRNKLYVSAQVGTSSERTDVYFVFRRRL